MCGSTQHESIPTFRGPLDYPSINKPATAPVTDWSTLCGGDAEVLGKRPQPIFGAPVAEPVLEDDDDLDEYEDDDLEDGEDDLDGDEGVAFVHLGYGPAREAAALAVVRKILIGAALHAQISERERDIPVLLALLSVLTAEGIYAAAHFDRPLAALQEATKSTQDDGIASARNELAVAALEEITFSLEQIKEKLAI